MIHNAGFASRLTPVHRILFTAVLLTFAGLSLPADSENESASPQLSKIAFLEDPESRLGIDTLREDTSLFRDCIDGQFEFGILDHPVWIRAVLPVSVPLANMVLTINAPGIREAELYLPFYGTDGLEYHRIEGGLTRNPSDLDWKYRYMAYRLPANMADGAGFYLRINPGGHTGNFTLALESLDYFQRLTWLETGVIAICFGVLIGMILYNVSLYLFLRDRNYLLYVLYILFMFLYEICHSGTGRIMGIPRLINLSIPVSALAYIFALAFAQHFLKTRQNVRRLHYFMYGVMTLSAIALILSLSGVVAQANRITHLIGVLAPIIMVVIGIMRIRQGFYPARYYLAAWIVLCITILILVLVGFELIPYNFITYNAHAIGSAVEAVILSMALGDRVRTLRRERHHWKEHERRLTELTITDELTGLYNRRGYTAKIPFEIQLARKNGWNFSLLVLDIDRFKQFNDTYGHSAGDHILKELGKIIISSIRNMDIPCRYGGEEFVIMLPGIALNRAESIAERIRRNVEARRIELEDGRSARFTVSIGATTLHSDDDEAALFDRADSALYAAKNEGRNRTIISGHR